MITMHILQICLVQLMKKKKYSLDNKLMAFKLKEIIFFKSFKLNYNDIIDEWMTFKILKIFYKDNDMDYELMTFNILMTFKLKILIFYKEMHNEGMTFKILMTFKLKKLILYKDNDMDDKVMIFKILNDYYY